MTKNNNWESEWNEMPEFVQDNKMSFRKIIVHFRNNEDINQFSKLLNQKITNKTKSLWFPPDIKDNVKRIFI